jgi:hypothetical protein
MSVEQQLAQIGPVELDGFEVWDRYGAAPAQQARAHAFVSLRVGGVMYLNRAAHAMIGEPEAVRVMFDKKRKRFGLIPSDPGDRRSYNIGGRWCDQSLTVNALCQHYGFHIEESRRYLGLEVVDGVLIVDVSDGAPYMLARRGK